MSSWFSLATIEWQYVLGSTPLEVIATVCSVLGVFLIARQNVWGWPLGLVWAGISTYLAFTQWQLVSDGILYASYIPIQIYCWAVWVRRGAVPETPFVPCRRLRNALRGFRRLRCCGAIPRRRF